MAVDGNVYDVSKFSRIHPGGEKVMSSPGRLLNSLLDCPIGIMQTLQKSVGCSTTSTLATGPASPMSWTSRWEPERGARSEPERGARSEPDWGARSEPEWQRAYLQQKSRSSTRTSN